MRFNGAPFAVTLFQSFFLTANGLPFPSLCVTRIGTGSPSPFLFPLYSSWHTKCNTWKSREKSFKRGKQRERENRQKESFLLRIQFQQPYVGSTYYEKRQRVCSCLQFSGLIHSVFVLSFPPSFVAATRSVPCFLHHFLERRNDMQMGAWHEGDSLQAWIEKERSVSKNLD